ncbi:MAG: hypothetical protein HUJ76_03435 [Parasporobacterium sp.]|nr:hypothetical protein [Parasporobacterium sp.]
MKLFNFLSKLIIAVLAICGACYIFSLVVEKINEENTEDDTEGCFFCRLRKAAGVQMGRIKNSGKDPQESSGPAKSSGSAETVKTAEAAE